ncbi:hypothetical protein [Aliivibrio salmonicida]|uniref:hypothetical protein n=1 Tax=Aliivibrio salmonicida TaxID=40269 RepID=UPI003D0C1D3E
MAIEKLTGPRLFQLIFLLVVLISAFTWRTITYEENNPIKSTIKTTALCDISKQACSFNVDGKQVSIDVEKRPIMQHATLRLLTDGLDSNWIAEATSVGMQMGSLKFTIPTKLELQMSYSTFVPQCTHNKMTWQVNFSNGEQVISVIFVSER